MKEKNFKKLISIFIQSLYFDVFVILCIIASVSLLVVDCSVNVSPATQKYIDIVELCLNIFFIIEYLTRISLAPKWWIFFKGNLIDFIALLPILRFFRLVRIIRLVRVIKIAGFRRWGSAITRKTESFSSDFQGRSIESEMIVFLLVVILLIGSVGILICEKGHNNQFNTFLDGFWWSIVTLTTVGYGDKFPITLEGRILAVVLMLFGLSFFALITGFISSFLLQRYKREEYTGMDLIEVKDHIVVCGWNSNAPIVIKELVSLYEVESRHVVIIAEEKPDFLLTKKVHFIKGDFTKKEILNLAQIEFASSVIVLADKTIERTDQDIDARTILTSLSIVNINPDIYSCAEILSPDNVEHIINSKIDEFILSASFTANLLAHSVKNHGIVNVYGELLKSSEGNQIYKKTVLESYMNMSFKECAIDILHKSSGILIGIERAGKYLINPKDEKILKHDMLLLISRER